MDINNCSYVQRGQSQALSSGAQHEDRILARDTN